MPLVDFPGLGFTCCAFAEHRPTFPEFLGNAWHLPLDRILADFRRGSDKATLFLGARCLTLRQTGWSGPEEVRFEGPGLQQVRFRPLDNHWTVESGDGTSAVFAASPKSAPRTWYLSEIRQGEQERLRFAYHHGKCTHLLEVRDIHGHCVRFEHAPLRGDHSRLLLRAISVEGPKRSTLARLQLSYVLQRSASGDAARLHSLLLRENGPVSPSRNLRGSFEYFPSRRNRPLLLKAIHFTPRSSQLLVPAGERAEGCPHPLAHDLGETASSVRVWHEELCTVVAEQVEQAGKRSIALTLYSRRASGPRSRRILRHCQANLDQAHCRISGDQVLIALPSRIKPGWFEVLLWRQRRSSPGWASHRRLVRAASLEFLEPSADGPGLQVVRDTDPFTCLQYHWFDQPRAWSLTCMVPVSCGATSAGTSAVLEPEQDSLFARRSGSTSPRDADLPELRPEDRIDWRPGELFAGLEAGPDLALIS